VSTITQTFAAIGDPVRLTIVDRLADSDATVGELAGMFDISFQAVSRYARLDHVLAGLMSQTERTEQEKDE